MLANGRGGTGAASTLMGLLSKRVRGVTWARRAWVPGSRLGLISPPFFGSLRPLGAAPSLLMECQPPGLPDASPAILSCVLQACVATMFQCVHFWGWKALESSVDHGDATAPKEMTGFQMTLCSVLVRKLRQGTTPGARGFIL